MKQVIQPAIDGGKTIQGWRLVGHETYSNKQPDEGMVEPLPDFDPSVCSVNSSGKCNGCMIEHLERGFETQSFAWSKSQLGRGLFDLFIRDGFKI